MATPEALIVIDVQQGFDDPRWPPRNNPQAEANVARLLAGWRAAGAPVFLIRHDSAEPGSPLRPDTPGNAFKPEAAARPGEPVIAKSVNSAFIGTDLEERLRRAGIGRLVICGISTDHCVSTTTRMAANLGFAVRLVGDACCTFDRRAPDGGVIEAEQVHRTELAVLSGEFAEIVTTDQALDGNPAA